MSTKNRDSLLKALKCRSNRSGFREECARCPYYGLINGLQYCDYHELWRDAYKEISGKEADADGN